MSFLSQVDGIGYDTDPSSTITPNPGVFAGRKFKWFGQTNNTVAGNVANQGMGSVALPALTNGTTGTVTITDTTITATSIVFYAIKRGTTTAAAGALASLVVAAQPPGTGSVVVDVRNAGTAATLSTDYVLHYWVIN